ncbi:MAG: hypothetical protein L0215_23020 [Gemmataceae bacterium]|nr:hypothetical protein [Gemmataceae bacterium]
MVQGYYTLQEAAHVLGISPDELKQIAQRKQVRSFQDRGTLRFRIQDIQELARQRGGSSDPDLVLGEAGPATPRSAKSDVSPRTPQKQQPASGASPRPQQAGPRTPQDSPEVFAFSLEGDEKVDIGAEHKSDPRRKGPKSPSPIPKPGSDSDVKLVAEQVSSDPGSGSDSDVKLVGPESDLASRTPKVQKKSGLGPVSPVPKKIGGPPDSAPPKRPSRLAGPGQPDSGVRLVPMDSDSDVKIVSGSGEDINLGQGAPPAATDSDIRLEKYQQPTGGGDERGQLTEEINLDEEIKKKEAAIQKQPQVKVKPKSKVKLPQPTSPFELSESDIDQPAKAQGKPDSSDFEVAPKKKDDSSDFDLTPQKEPSSVLEPEDSDFSLELPEEGGESAPLKGPSSGINLSKPVDSGISLEDSGADSSVDFDLSLEVESTPKPAKSKKEPVSDSDFELSLEESGKKGAPADSDSSEFELTLDDSSANLELEQIKAGSEEKDIFETDFDPGLEEESGSQVAALETDLESSDFDISLDDSSVESGSQVVALDEEADEAAATIATDAPEIEVELDEEGAGVAPGQVRIKEVVREKLIEPAPWGALPVVFMLPCVIVMLLVGLLGFELAQSASGFKSAGFLTRTIGEMIGQKIK